MTFGPNTLASFKVWTDEVVSPDSRVQQIFQADIAVHLAPHAIGDCH